VARYTLQHRPDGIRRITVELVGPTGRTETMSLDALSRKELMQVALAVAQFAKDVRSGAVAGQGGAGKPKEAT